jgi:hypothetical protein
LTFFATLVLIGAAVFVYARISKEESSVQEVLIKILNYISDVAGARKTATTSTFGEGGGESRCYASGDRRRGRTAAARTVCCND